MDYPDVFVDEALGFAVGILYWYGSSSPHTCFAVEIQKAGQLYEHGHFDHSRSNVHAVLEPKLWHRASDLCTTSANCSDECMWREGKNILTVK